MGFTDGEWVQLEGHNTVEPYTSHLSRSLDGGRTWANETPTNYVGNCPPPVAPPGGIPFTDPSFALRVIGTGYHGNEQPGGAFLYSTDRGHSWEGPFSFGDLTNHPELAGMEMTPRTQVACPAHPAGRVAARIEGSPAPARLRCYVVEGESEITVLLSARPAKGDGLKVVTDKVFLARSSSGGASFSFEGWIIPLSDPYRAVMPAITLVSPTEWVVALRRREVDDPTRDAWIDVCRTTDRG